MQTLQIKNTRIDNSRRIIKMLRWTELEYATFINETGLQYLEEYIPNDRAGIEALNHSRIFWNWWKNHWGIRDEQFLEIAYESDSVAILNKLYRGMHCINVLTMQIFPNAVVLEDSYAQMISHFNKTITL